MMLRRAAAVGSGACLTVAFGAVPAFAQEADAGGGDTTLIAIGAGAAGLAFFLLIAILFGPNAAVERDLKGRLGSYLQVEQDRRGLSRIPLLRRFVTQAESVAEQRGLLTNIERALEQANVPIRPGEAIAGAIAAAILIGVLSGLGGTAIILKSQALSVKVKPFIDAARIAGGGHWRIITRHIIPNVLPLSFLYMMFAVTGAIFTEAALSFLGLLNIQQSWGIMINIAHTQGYTLEGLDVWWLMLPAGLSITLFSAGFFLVGRAMDEVVNPRLRKR